MGKHFWNMLAVSFANFLKTTHKELYDSLETTMKKMYIKKMNERRNYPIPFDAKWITLNVQGNELSSHDLVNHKFDEHIPNGANVVAYNISTVTNEPIKLLEFVQDDNVNGFIDIPCCPSVVVLYF